MAQSMEKITEIMNLIGVSPRDFARAAANFRSMPEAELDIRLAHLRAGEQRIETWRQERRLAPAAAKVVPQELLTDQLWNRLQTSNALIDRHVSDLRSLIDRLERQGAAISAEAAEAVERMVQTINNCAAERTDNWIAEVAERWKRGEGSTLDGAQLAERLRQSVSEMTRSSKS
jgi:hypothetical protein